MIKQVGSDLVPFCIFYVILIMMFGVMLAVTDWNNLKFKNWLTQATT